MNPPSPVKKQKGSSAIAQKPPSYISGELDYLEKVYRDHFRLDNAIYDFFDAHPNCYMYILDLVSHTKDFLRGRASSFTRQIMKAFAEWSKNNDMSWKLTKELKEKALHTVLKQSSGGLIAQTCDIFKIKEDPEVTKQVVEDLISRKKFREAYITTSHLNLEKEFSLAQIALPLFFLEKQPWLLEYLKKCPELQLQLVQTIDSVLNDEKNILDLVRSLNISEPRKHVYDPVWLQKKLVQYLDAFNIDLRDCPNLHMIRTSGAMHYMIRRRYTEDTISAEPWEELVCCIVADYPLLQKELLINVVCFNDCETGLKLARKFDINENEWPPALHTFYYTSCNTPDDNVQESWHAEYSSESSLSYLTLRLDMSDICFVDDKEKFLLAIKDISENYDIVGVDAEWRPSLGLTKERTALLQLAVWDTVYLLDILKLKDCLKKDSWELMMNSIFYNAEILKLGYGIHNDLRLLVKLFNESEDHKYSRVIDAGVFFTKVKKLYPSITDHISDYNEVTETYKDLHKGLSMLCLILLGKPLNKEQQFSDWERRPLRDKQVVYAALDAFCLLLIYEKFFHILKKMELDFDAIVDMPSTPEKKSPKKNSPQKMEHEPSLISDFKIVVDSMLHGLGRHLRVCGADVVIVTNKQEHMNCLKIAQEDHRIILTTGTPYKKMKGYMPADSCLCVPETLPVKEQTVFVLTHFNVHLTEAGIFSRCTVCNGNHYLKVPSEDLKFLWSKLAKHQDLNACEIQKELEEKPFFKCEDGFITENGVLHTGIPLKMDYLTSEVFLRVNVFLICSKCGKVYWEGSHFGRVKKNLSNYVQLSEDAKENIYQLSNEKPVESLEKQNSDLNLVAACSTPNNDSKTESSISMNSEDNDQSYTSQQNRCTMQFELGSDTNSDYDSDDLN